MSARCLTAAMMLAALPAPAPAHEAPTIVRMFADLATRAQRCAVYARHAARDRERRLAELAARYLSESRFALDAWLAEEAAEMDGLAADLGPVGAAPVVPRVNPLPAQPAQPAATRLIAEAEADLTPPPGMATADIAAHRFAVASQRYDELGCEDLLQ